MATQWNSQEATIVLGDCFSSVKKDRYLGLLRQGAGRQAAAKAAGVTYRTIFNYTKSHPEFAEEVDFAEMESCFPIEMAMYQKALEGSFPHAVFYLQNRSASRWEDKRKPNVTQVITSNTEDVKQQAEDLLDKIKELPE